MSRWVVLVGTLLGLILLTRPMPGFGQGKRGTDPPMVYNAENRHYYQVIAAPGGIDWVEAFEAAKKHSFMGVPGHLVTPFTRTQQAFVAGNLFVPGSFLGAYQDPKAPDFKEPDRGWRWVTGDPWGEVAWDDGEPNNSSPHCDFADFTDRSR